MSTEFIVQCIAFAAGVLCGIVIRMCFEQFARQPKDGQ